MTTNPTIIFKVVTVEELFALNKRAIKNRKNRSLDPTVLSSYLPNDDPTMLCPVIFSMTHNDCEMRVVVVVARDRNGTDCQPIQLDIEFEDYENLRESPVQ